MLKNLSTLSLALVLCGCGVLPGMNNVDTHAIKTYRESDRIKIEPTLIPITPSLLAKQHRHVYLYRIAPADVLHIHVWQHPEFLAELPSAAASSTPGVQGAAGQPGYLVNSHGYIYFPLVGYVHVAGKTADQVRVMISKRLEKYVPNPQVNVRVADFRGQKVYVLGEVEKTGFLPITDQTLSLADALSLSGWLRSDTADPRHVYIIRGDMSKPQIFWLDARTPDKILTAEHFYLQPHDVLYVSSAPAARWNRALNQILPTVQAIWYTQAVVKNA